MADDELVGLIESVRDACLRRLLAAYESAAISGLCCEGAWEVAVGHLRSLDGRQLREAMQAADPQ